MRKRFSLEGPSKEPESRLMSWLDLNVLGRSSRMFPAGSMLCFSWVLAC